MRVEIEIFGEKQISRELVRFADRTADMMPAFREVAEMFYAVEREQFDSEGAFSGGWKPLADTTVARKARQGLDSRILHATLALRDSLTGPNNRGSILKILPDAMEIGTSIRYAEFHQRGRGVPRRRPVDLTPAHRREIMKIVQRHMVGGMGGV